MVKLLKRSIEYNRTDIIDGNRNEHILRISRFLSCFSHIDSLPASLSGRVEYKTSWRFCTDKRFSEIPKIECSEQTVGS